MVVFLRLAPVPDSQTQTAAARHITVVLADDHQAMRRSLRALLDGEPDVEVLAETDSLSATLRHVQARRPDVLVLDVGLSLGHGLEMIRELHARAPQTRIVVLTTNDDPAFAEGALGSGALALVLKEMADSDLPAAVRSTWNGRRYLSPAIAERLPIDLASTNKDRLTPREREVLRLIALGHTSVEIATTLGLSPRTIETHRARIHRKLGLTTRAELVDYALRHKLLQL